MKKLLFHIFVISFTACLLYFFLVFSNPNNSQLAQADQELLIKQFKEAEENYQTQHYEKSAKIAGKILQTHSQHLTEEQKHQLGVYLWRSDRKKLAFDLMNEEKIKKDEKLMSSIVLYLQPVWRQRVERLGTFAAVKKLCGILVTAMSVTTQPHNLIDLAGHFCLHYDFYEQGEKLYNKFINEVERLQLPNRVELQNLARGNIGISKTNVGLAEGKKEIWKACKNLLSALPKERLEPPGKNSPYVLSFIDNLSGFPNTTIHSKTAEILRINTPPPPNSGLSHPQITEIHDRDVQLVEISEVYHPALGLFRRKNHEFIIYDTGSSKILDTFVNIALKYNISEFPTHSFGRAVFTGAYQDNYYHWIIEGMARLVYLIDIGFFEQYPDAVVPRFSDKPFVSEAMDLIHFPKHKRQPILLIHQGANTYYEKLHVPIFVPWETPHLLPLNPTQMHIPPPSLIRLLNKYYNPNPLPLRQRTKIVYAGRPDISPRKTLFDSKLVEELRRLFGNRLVVLPSPPPSVAAQRTIFSQARIIVGPHGAALSNMIFAAPNQTAVIIFPIETLVFDNPFSNIAASLGMYYWTLPAVSAHYKSDYVIHPDPVPSIVNAVLQTAQFMDTLE